MIVVDASAMIEVLLNTSTGVQLAECRSSLALRFIFQDRQTDLFVSSLGDHDDIKSLLRSGRYR